MNRTEAETPAIVVQNNFKVGYLCFSDVGPADMEATDLKSGILLASNPHFDAIIRSATEKVDALIVSFHFGIEYESVHSGQQEALAKKAINDGAVMVVGHHPHVPQDIAYYDSKPVFYSLGNFIFDQYFSKETMGGLFITANLIGKNVSDVTTHQIVLSKSFVPSLQK
jgi:poly-gamma-glutamate synthesis protein (capsule biosynthesis protein)